MRQCCGGTHIYMLLQYAVTLINLAINPFSLGKKTNYIYLFDKNAKRNGVREIVREIVRDRERERERNMARRNMVSTGIGGGAASPPIPDCIGNMDPIDLENKRNKLVKLYHAAHCTYQGDGDCPDVQYCCATKRLFQHIVICTRECSVPGCKKSRKIWKRKYSSKTFPCTILFSSNSSNTVSFFIVVVGWFQITENAKSRIALYARLSQPRMLAKPFPTGSREVVSPPPVPRMTVSSI